MSKVKGSRGIVVHSSDLTKVRNIIISRGLIPVVMSQDEDIIVLSIKGAPEEGRPYVLGLYVDGMITSVDPTFEWTEENSKVDVRHCDICGVRHERKKIFQ